MIVCVVWVACACAEPPVPVWERLPTDTGATLRLSELELFEDGAMQTLAADYAAFAPAHELWTDAAQKRRWLRLPEGTRIDASDTDHWRFPVGSMLFKEFARDGVRLETRLIARIGEGDDDYWMGSFLWDAEQRDAVWVPEGRQNVLGTDHDVPSAKRCWTCHNGEPGRMLGISALQVAGEQGQPTRDELRRRGWSPDDLQSSHPLGAGDDVQARALGYLHANCGHCHNPHGSAWPDTDMVLRLGADERVLERSELYRSTLAVETQYFAPGEGQLRIAAGEPDISSVVMRMQERGSRTQMPSLGSKHVDEQGLGWVHDWIAQLPAP